MTYRAENTFVFILVTFSAGIIVFYPAESAKLNFVLPLFNIAVFILLFIINCLYVSLKVYHHRYLIGLLFAAFFFTLGGLRCEQQKDLHDSRHFMRKQASFLRVSVDEEPVSGNGILKFRVKVLQAYFRRQHNFATGNLLVLVHTDKPSVIPVKYGDILIIPASYIKVEPPYNPAGFDYKSWLASRNVYHQLWLSPWQLAATGENQGNPMISFFLGLRLEQVNFCRSLIKDNDAFAVAAALLLGYRTDLGPTLLSAYSKTGTIHALSVSGMHVGMIYLLLEQLFKFLNQRKSGKILKVILILGLIWFYTLLTGCSPSVLRAAIMLSTVVLARLVNKTSGNYNVLAFSACCLLCYDPFLLWDAGFQLSFLSVFGLIWLQPGIQRLFAFKFKWPQKIWDLMALSLAAQVTTFPFTMYYFHQFPLYFMISNLFIALPMVMLMYIGVVMLLFRFAWLAYFFEKLIVFMNRGLDYIAHLPYSGLSGIWISKTELLLLYLFIFSLIPALSGKNKSLLFLSLFSLLALEIHLINDHIRAIRQQKIILFTLQRNYAVAFISSRRAVVVTGLTVTDKAFNFSVRPALDQLKINDVTCVSGKKDTSCNGLVISNHQLSYKKFRVLLADTTFNRKRIKGQPVFDAVWIQDTPEISFRDLYRDVRFKAIWIDATNKDYAVKNYQPDAAKINIAIVILRKNKASLIDLNEVPLN
jgi:competence protein ComEC